MRKAIHEPNFDGKSTERTHTGKPYDDSENLVNEIDTDPEFVKVLIEDKEIEFSRCTQR